MAEGRTSRVPRIAVIGTGYWGRNHVRNFHALGALAAICDSNPAAVAGVAKDYPGVQSFTDPAAVLARTDIDGVVIATPAATHGELAAAALAQRKHVLVEKPLCLDLGEAARLREQSVRTGVTLMVGHVLLYHPAFRQVRNLVQKGALGPLRYVYSNRLSLGKIRREENALWSFAPHDISMILALAGSMPTRVSASGGHYLAQGVADTTLSHLRFGDGLQAHVFVSWLHPYKDHRLVVIGAEAMLVFDDTQPSARKVLMYKHDVRWKEDIPVVAKADAEPISIEDGEPLRGECETFLGCIRDGTKPPSDADEAIRVLRVLDACQRAIAAEGSIAL